MESRLKHFPISYFAVILGFSGLTIATIRAEHIFDIHGVSLVFGYATAGLYFFFLVIYLAKLIKFPKDVLHELHHPIKISFFPTISISLILLSIIFLGSQKELSKYLLLTGMPMHLFFTLYIISKWIRHEKLEIKHKNPAWFIPVVGNVLVPIPAMAHFHEDLSWFFFSIGFILWIVLFTIFIYRAIFHKPLPDKLLPTFFILIAPPAISFISYFKMTGEIDGFAKMLYYFAVFTFLLLLWNSKNFMKIKFYLSWWAYSFPIAALTISSFLMFEQTKNYLFEYFGITLLAFLVILIIFLIIKTLTFVFNKKICIPEED